MPHRGDEPDRAGPLAWVLRTICGQAGVGRLDFALESVAEGLRHGTSTDADCGRASQLLAGVALGACISRRPRTEEGAHGKMVCGTANDKRPEAKRKHGML